MNAVQQSTIRSRQPYAPLKNLALLRGLAQRLMDRDPDLPGIGVFYGHSGYGKTHSVTYVQNSLAKQGIPAPRVEVLESWNRLEFMKAIVRELGIDQPKGSLPALAQQAIEILGDARHPPLMIDEADKLVDKNMIELVRELHMGAQVPIILIGEEALPSKLVPYERVNNRVLDWVAAQPCDFEDTKKLAEYYCTSAIISDPLIEQIRIVCEGRARRIATNVHMIADTASRLGLSSVDVGQLDHPFYTGTPPLRRHG